MQKKLVSQNPMRNIKAPKIKKRLPKFLKEGEMNDLLEGDFFENDFTGVRDKLIIEMFYNLGIRLSELIGIKIGDVDMYAMTVLVTGKRNKQRLIPFGENLRCSILEYEKSKKESVSNTF